MPLPLFSDILSGVASNVAPNDATSDRYEHHDVDGSGPAVRRGFLPSSDAFHRGTNGSVGEGGMALGPASSSRSGGGAGSGLLRGIASSGGSNGGTGSNAGLNVEASGVTKCGTQGHWLPVKIDRAGHITVKLALCVHAVLECSSLNWVYPLSLIPYPLSLLVAEC